MKQTIQVKIAKFFILLATILFLSAIVTQIVGTEIHVNNILYLAAIISFGVGAVLSLIAAYKDKEHMKNVELSKKDERIKTIRCLSKAKAFDIFSFIFPLVLMFCSSLKIIDFNATIIFGIMCLIPQSLQLYYFNELSKKCRIKIKVPTITCNDKSNVVVGNILWSYLIYKFAFDER